ncbi:hypothetical protein [Variovorax paradoxus]|uniref:hypothetical protein n=1 Tax=Variovorax paradoxus TaxID=34073 RepID=UPI0028676EC8|nr:hypothetical protein [Variovorax paradoxus]MDR6453454.1 hypothetical protein [Variovorax paradoxus]
MNVSNEDFRQCGKIIASHSGDLRVRSDPKNKILKDGIYIILPRLNNKWIMSIYRDRCLGTNELEVTVDPVAMAQMSSVTGIQANVYDWLEHQRDQLQNETARNRIKDSRINTFDIGFTLAGAHEFLRRFAKMLEWPFPTWEIDPTRTWLTATRKSAVDHMMEMAYQAAAASGTQRVEVAKKKEVRFESEEQFRAHIEVLLREPVCAITKLPLDISFADLELAPSLDRRDSNGHYEPGNLQVVARFVNRWKSDDNQANFQRLIDLLRGGPDPAPSIS